jgi:hypothetical protein
MILGTPSLREGLLVGKWPLSRLTKFVRGTGARAAHEP